MGHGFQTRYVVTMASGGTLSSEVDLGRAFPTVYVGMPANGPTAECWVQAAGRSSAAGGTYRRICHPVVNTSTVAAPNAFVIASATSGLQIPLPNGQRFLKIETSAAVANGCEFEIIVGDD